MAATAAIGWYGPLIDLANASSHIGGYVQLLVFVHLSRPIKKFKASNGGALLRTDIQVGDDTRSHFSISLWQKQMGSIISAGDIILLQNAKIIKFGDVLEASTVQFSSLLHLVHPDELISSKGVAGVYQTTFRFAMDMGVEEIVASCQVGKTTKEKLKMVIKWVQQTESMNLNNFCNIHAHQSKEMVQPKRHLLKNWKTHDEITPRDCISISELSCLTDSCSASFNACIGEIVLPFTKDLEGELEQQKLFVSKRLFVMADGKIAEDLIVTGCKLCGSPMDSCLLSEQSWVQSDCPKSSNRQHHICLIYRPFLLYVWDQSGHIPILVKNAAAERVFGSITAESVYLSLEACRWQEKDKRPPDRKGDHEHHQCNPCGATHAENAASYVGSSVGEEKPKSKVATLSHEGIKAPKYDRIWVIMLKMLLLQGRNSPFRFEVSVNCRTYDENARFELLSFTMPFPV